jgi:hypothetical protein
VWHQANNSARVGLVYAHGPDADSALACARRAAESVTVRVKPDTDAGSG